MSEQHKMPGKSIPLGQAPQANPKVEEFRRAAPVTRLEGEALSAQIIAANGDARGLAERVLENLQTVFDPEIPVNIVDLGLIYRVEVDADFHARLQMTLTAPACPVADSIVREVETKVRNTPGIEGAKVELVWSPPWDKSRMSDAALLELGLL
jgi:FeS assembly SUF system protein